MPACLPRQHALKIRVCLPLIRVLPTIVDSVAATPEAGFENTDKLRMAGGKGDQGFQLRKSERENDSFLMIQLVLTYY